MSLPRVFRCGPRKADPVWRHFDRVEAKSGVGSRGRCRRCARELPALVNRLKQHHAKCGAAPHLDQDQDEDQDQDPETTCESDSPQPDPSTGPSTPASSPPSTRKSFSQLTTARRRTTLKNSTALGYYIIRTSALEKALLDEHIARMVFATNSPFHLADNPQFRNMITKIRPGYTPPTTKEMEEKFLPLVYEKERKKCADELKDETVCLSLDGLSNTHREPIICVTVTTTNGHLHLVDTIDASAKAHDPLCVQILARTSIRKVEEEFGCQVRSLVSDAVTNVGKIRKPLVEAGDNHIEIITYGCSAHILNLLAKDLEMANIKDHVDNVVKYFRNNHFAAARYRQEGGQALVIPEESRWSTMAECFKIYINNRSILLKICEVDRDRIDARVRAKVRNLGLKRAAEDLLGRLEEIDVALEKTRRNACTIAEALQIWKELCLKFEHDHEVNRKVKARYNQAITKAHLLANMLHPSFQGISLSEDEKNAAIQYANEKCPSLIPTLIKFQTRAPPFQDSQFEKEATSRVSACEWWRSHGEVVGKESLALIVQLLSALASSAGGNRVLSSFGVAQSELRSRLGAQNATKFLFLLDQFNHHQ